MDKSRLSETDICEKFISPALTASGWDVHEQTLREYPLRPGRMVVRGQKASRDKRSVLRADYVLFWKANIPLAVIEAKDNTQAIGAGMKAGAELRRTAGRALRVRQQRRRFRIP